MNVRQVGRQTREGGGNGCRLSAGESPAGLYSQHTIVSLSTSPLLFCRHSLF